VFSTSDNAFGITRGFHFTAGDKQKVQESESNMPRNMYRFNVLKHAVHITMLKNSPTSQKIHCAYGTQTSLLMIYRETVAVYCKKNMKNILSSNFRVLNVKLAGVY
jgi:hypothetical protein